MRVEPLDSVKTLASRNDPRGPAELAAEVATVLPG